MYCSTHIMHSRNLHACVRSVFPHGSPAAYLGCVVLGIWLFSHTISSWHHVGACGGYTMCMTIFIRTASMDVHVVGITCAPLFSHASTTWLLGLQCALVFSHAITTLLYVCGLVSTHGDQRAFSLCGWKLQGSCTFPASYGACTAKSTS